jgi:excinuclease ABC subunit B
MAETERRRKMQEAYNTEMGITPETIKSQIKDILGSIYEADYLTPELVAEESVEYDLTEKSVRDLEAEMKEAAKGLDFERAAEIRDKIKAIRDKMLQLGVKEKVSEKAAKKRISKRKAK